MVPRSRSGKLDISISRSTINRPICHQIQQQTPFVCKSCARPSGHGHRCSIHKLGGFSVYAFPPRQIIPKILKKFRETNHCRMILIAPLWPNQIWYPELIRLAKSNPLRLPVKKSLLKQPRSNVFHSDPGFLNLHAWMLQKES